jgi:hypothetical protein
MSHTVPSGCTHCDGQLQRVLYKRVHHFYCAACGMVYYAISGQVGEARGRIPSRLLAAMPEDAGRHGYAPPTQQQIKDRMRVRRGTARGALLALSALLAAVLLSGCAVVDYSGYPPGTVVDTSKRSVTVRLDGTGKTVTHKTSKKVARRCRKADPPRWPDCT